MADPVAETRKHLRTVLKDYAKPVQRDVSEEQALKGEATYAASDLKAENAAQRIKAIEFLEILGGNPYAEEHLLSALGDVDGGVVMKAVLALGKIGTTASLPKLHEFLKNVRSRQLSAEIARVIAKLEKKD